LLSPPAVDVEVEEKEEGSEEGKWDSTFSILNSSPQILRSAAWITQIFWFWISLDGTRCSKHHACICT
jgi:hypothetical protein